MYPPVFLLLGLVSFIPILTCLRKIFRFLPDLYCFLKHGSDSRNDGVERFLVSLSQSGERRLLLSSTVHISVTDNTDLLYITDFSLPLMRSLPTKLAKESVPLILHTLDQLILTHQHMPQQPCPLLSEGHGAHHGDDSHGDHQDGHEDDHKDKHENDHKDDHEDDKSLHDIHKRSYNEEKSESQIVKDFQTGTLSYYTLGRQYPDSFADEGITKPHRHHTIFCLGLRQIGVRTGEEFVEKDQVIKRRRLLPPTRYHKTIVIWLSEVEQIRRLLRMFAETITLCYQYIDVGIYDANDG